MPHGDAAHAEDQLVPLDRTVAHSIPVQDDERTYSLLVQSQEASRGARPPNFMEMMSEGYELHPAASVPADQVAAATCAAEAALVLERQATGGHPSGPPVIGGDEAAGLPPEAPSALPSVGSLVELQAQMDAMERRIHSRFEEVSGALSGLGIRLSQAPGAQDTLPPILPAPQRPGAASAQASGTAVSLDAKRRARQETASAALPAAASAPGLPSGGVEMMATAQDGQRLVPSGGMASLGGWTLAAAASLLAAISVGVMVHQLALANRGPAVLEASELVVRQTMGYGAYVREEQAALRLRPDGGPSLLALERVSGIRVTSTP